MTTQGIVGAWVACAVVLTAGTQLRAQGLPVGPGELLLAAWILFVGFLLLRGTVRFGPAFHTLLLYWLLAFTLLGLGALVASAVGLQDRNTARHDLLAFVLAAVVTCFLALDWSHDGQTNYHLQLARQTLFFCTALSTAVLIVAQIHASVGPVRFWYGGVRFTGLAKDPNQMALFAVAMPFLGWYLMQRTHGAWRKTAYLMAIAGAVAVGIATLSESLRVAWIGTLCTVGGILWLRSIAYGRGWLLAVPFALVPFAVIFLGVMFGEEIVLEIERVMRRTYEEGDQGETRFTLWLSGLEAIRQSPLFGFGPGAYSGAFGPFGGSEAHNSWIDWGMSTGILGIVLHLGLLAWCAVRALRANSLPLFAIVEALAIFSLFIYTLRQPIYWLMLFLVLTFTEQPRPLAAHRSRDKTTVPIRAGAAVSPRHRRHARTRFSAASDIAD